MHKSAYVNAENFFHKYCEKDIENKKILDVGSYDVNGTMKPIFEKGNYVGLDMEKGPNVDVVGVSHKIPFTEEEFDIVISSSCFEHDDMFWVSFTEMCRVLKPGGYMYVQAPSNGPYHGWPGDNWRFYEDSWKALEKWGKQCGYEIELVESYISEPSHGDIWKDSVGIFRKKNFNKVALISSYCDTPKKVEVLKNNIQIIKSQNLDVILISPFYLEKDIVDLCDYFFITKDNPVFVYPEKAMIRWKKFFPTDREIKIFSAYPDYGFAGLTQVKQLSEIALNLGYNQFFHIIYDLVIDENVIEAFKSNKTKSIYSFEREIGNVFLKTSLHFMVFDKKNLMNFISKITTENYLKDNTLYVETWLNQICTECKFDVENTSVKDHVFYYENVDLLNHSPIDELKFFIEKNTKTKDSLKLFFFDNDGVNSIGLEINGEIKNLNVEDLDIVDLGFYELDENKVVVNYKGIIYDLNPIIKNLKHSEIKIEYEN